jgi:hypothetical protein
MIERVIENWLDKANERSFQTPFCHTLAADGYTVIHLTRHCAMEMGKDIIAIAPDGTPCAYQLKGVNGGKLSLARWRSEVQSQITPLVINEINHPSVPTDKPHRSFLVINGELEEEVSNEIIQFNETTGKKLGRKLEIIVRGQLLERFKQLNENFLPNELVDIRTLLELYMERGDGFIDKTKISSLLMSSLLLDQLSTERPSDVECSRAIAGSAILTSLILSPFIERNNHAAEFEGWTFYFAYVLALAEKANLPQKFWKNEIDIALLSMYNALGRLCDELMERPHFSEGSALAEDQTVYKIRTTYIISLMSIYRLWRKQNDEPNSQHDEFVEKFVKENSKHLFLWGEYAIPQFIDFYFLIRWLDSSLLSKRLLIDLIKAITIYNRPRGKGELFSPYYDAETTLPYLTGIETNKLEDNFVGRSYTLESIVHLFVRTNFKQTMCGLWPSVTKIAQESFQPEIISDYYLWRCKKGICKSVLIQKCQVWQKLREQANECEGNEIPVLIKNYPIQYLCFLTVFPHRLTTNGIRWVASKLED